LSSKCIAVTTATRPLKSKKGGKIFPAAKVRLFIFPENQKVSAV